MRLYYFCLLIITLAFVSCQNPTKLHHKTSKKKPADSIAIKSASIDSIQTSLAIAKPKKSPIKNSEGPKYSLRKYKNVTKFYARIANKATHLCMEKNIPPAAILAIAGLESGWNQGYISKITGNILSLGTRKGDHQLPALRLPQLVSKKKILFDSLEILKYSSEELIWETRPPCLKKDYRPLPYAGTQHNLAYFKHNPEKESQAHIQNLNDFMTHFISRKSKIPSYRNARKLMDTMVAEHGKDVLLQDSTAFLFINEIGGKPYSFNYRKSWPKKVNNIIKKAGLAELSQQLYTDKSEFQNVW